MTRKLAEPRLIRWGGNYGIPMAYNPAPVKAKRAKIVPAAAAAPTVNCSMNINTRFPSLILVDESLLTPGIAAGWIGDTDSG